MKHLNFTRIMLLCVALLLLVPLVLTGCQSASPAPAGKAPATSAAPVKAIEWRVHWSRTSGTAAKDDAMEKWLPAEVDKATGGRLKLIMAESLVQRDEALTATSDGRVDMAFWSPADYAAEFPWLSLNIAPGLWDGMKQMDDVLRKTNWFEEVTRSTKSRGVITVDTMYLPKHVLFSKKPMKSIETFKDVKVRVAGSELVSLMKEIGARPVSTAWSETYLAAQTGVMDALWTGAGPAYGISLFEVFKYVTDYTNFVRPTLWMQVMNQESFNALPKDIQPKLLEAIRKVSADELKGEVDGELAAYDQWRGKGATVEFITDAAELAKWKPAFTKVTNDWIASVEKKGYRFPQAMADYIRSRGFQVQ